MKPSLHQLGLATLLLGAAAQLHAQTHAAPPELLASSPPWASGSQFCWGTLPPPRPLPYGYVWSGYRGADIEHPLYAPKHHGAVCRSHCGGMSSQFCCWFDKLFTRKCTGDCCEASEGHVATDLPPLPTLAPFPPPAAPPELTPLPIPAPPVVAVPVPQPEPDQRLQPGPSDPAPLMPPVDLIPTRPLVTADPPASGPKPIASVPIEMAPIETPPIELIEPGLAPVDDPKPIANERPPVVELAPDFLLDGEPTTPVPPSPSVALPPAAVPRNAIPQIIVPRNTIPGSR